jgi:aminoglycoside phosphotransferase (APT) family kinase protein
LVDVEALVPREPLTAFLDEHVEDAGSGPVEVEKIGQGRSNLTFRVERGSQAWVLRRPPMGDLPETAHDMMREHRVLSGLRDTDVRAPRPLAACPDPAVIGVPFYLMQVVDGAVIREREPMSYSEADRHRIGLEMIDALAELHTADFAAIGLGDLGRPEGYTARQVERWSKQWEFMKTRELEDVEAVRAWLEEHCPAEYPHAIVHGDYKLDNVVFSHEPPARLLAILDWEMATLGDPLADVGYLMNFWPEPGEPMIGGLPQPTQQPGFPTRQELLERYEKATGFSMTDLTFYRTLALWKLAILMEGLYKRYLAGKADSDWFAVIEQVVPAMARQAREWTGA